MANLKQSCKSQFLAIWKEASSYIEQGYTKKAVYNFFSEQKKISMSYVAWTRLINNVNEDHPFSQKKTAQKKSIPDSPPTSKTVSVSGNKRIFQHDSTPYTSQSDLKPQEKKELKVNLISKKRRNNQRLS